jgi:hypothetical protein
MAIPSGMAMEVEPGHGCLLTLLDLKTVQNAASFNPDYLHLEHEGEGLNANISESG